MTGPLGRLARSNALRLTEREDEIAALAADGLRNKEIAAELHLTEGTVRTHLRRAYVRNGLRGRTELVAGWVRSRSSGRTADRPDLLDGPESGPIVRS